MWPIEDPTEQLRWRLSCHTPGTSSHEMTVLVVGDRVALIIPPADVLVFTAAEADDLARVLDTVAIKAQRSDQRPNPERPSPQQADEGATS